ncbi:uncharacterized protein TNCV_3696931 [Trichonephila clavipes]|uniref:Mutator-like transposase domain-containing protein n=1 Tax=Trichonephila clavipes TaxID=2585209 RepID=A0A8X6SAU3_TRICX|nr:uncharacterized protein TNCV_3696931 [Trichonephila clavipes]
MSKSTEELLLNSVESASRRKIKIPDLLKEQDSQNVNIIVELDLLSSLMKNLLCCKYCCSSEKIELREDLKSRRGLAVSLEIICHNCEESTSTMSSKISNKCYDVNLRLTYGMRAIGKGGAAARIFCGLMNLPPPPAKFERHNSLFLNVLKTISEDSMNAAVHEAVIANDNNSNIAVAVDGTWHKRGYSSLNGVVCATSVENGKWGNGMSGVLSIFQRSETSRKACYTQYLGDGDSKGFLTIKEAKVYGDTEVEKLECVGHVQKRMGTRLRNILKMSKGIKLSDGKNISGRGRLTLKEVDSIQHYYGLAIRKNLSSVEDVKRAIWAIYFHKLSTEDNPQHALCPLEKDLLKKCLHGRTQNPNESFNKCIWERIPKTVFVGIETLKFGVMDAVICFNDGYVSRIKVFEALGIKSGYNTERALLIIDNKRIFEAERIVNKVSLEARNKRRYLYNNCKFHCARLVKTESVDTAVQEVTNILIAAADLSIPKVSSHSFQRYKPWWNADCQTAYEKQRRLWGIFRRYPTTENLLAFKNAKANARRVRRRSQRQSWIRYVSSLTSSTSSK